VVSYTRGVEGREGIFADHVFNGLGMEFVGSRFLIIKSIAMDCCYTYA
jgi:hypothetical protein